MISWLRLLLMIFYAPLNGLREVRDRASVPQSGLIALLAHSAFFIYITWHYIRELLSTRRVILGVWALLQSAGVLIFLALAFVPLVLFIANLYERRASFRLLLQQEFSAVTSAVFYAMTAASLIAIILSVAGSSTGVLPVLAQRMYAMQVEQPGAFRPDMVPGFDPRLFTPNGVALALAFMTLFALFGIFATMAIHIVLRLSWVRSVVMILISGAILFPASIILLPIFTTVLSSPILLFMLFLFIRGYIGDIGRTHRSRVAFRQNLEAATLNPADASAHYNLGLIHQQRGDLDPARERYERAIQIDDNEIDAHYQLGRIARQQGRLADAIKNFEQVVARDPSHAQHEVWRDVGATYIEAGQFEDARNALEQFLEHRPSDPEGLYLMGRAHAGLGHRHEATSLMQACIEAVKTAPAYKYRASKRWLNEAQQFIKSGQ